MYIQNRRECSKFSGSSPLQICYSLTGLKPATAYFTYTQRCVKFPPIKKPAIRGGLRKAGMKQDVQEKPHLDRFIKTAVKIKEAGYGRQM
jgi:hypothetical protein